MHQRYLKYSERSNQENKSVKWEMDNGEKNQQDQVWIFKNYLVSDKPRLIKQKTDHTHTVSV